MRILFVATHPEQCTGYARIGNRVSNYLADCGHEVHYFAFQRYVQAGTPRFVHPSIRIIDVHTTATDRFGMDIIAQTMQDLKPDMLFIYNDIIVTCRIFNALLHLPKTYFVTCYLDLVYPYESYDLVQHVNRHADYIFAFSACWKHNLVEMGCPREKIGVFPHGFDSVLFTPVPTAHARARLGLHADDFIVLNSNRNSYRKALDITVRAFLLFWKSVGCPARVKLMLNCRMDVEEGYDIHHLIRIECLKLSLDYGAVTMHQILRLDSNGMLTDARMNDMYNACDVGMNTCVGEGFGLCNLEHGGLGKPQIVSGVGGLTDIFGGKNGAVVVEAPTVLTLARGIDAHSGEICIPDAQNFALALHSLYALSPESREQQGQKLRDHIVRTYNWPDLLHAFHADMCASKSVSLAKKDMRIFWINLELCADRRASMLQQFQALGIHEHTRIVPTPDPAEPHMSCLRAHYDAIRSGHASGTELAVIFEDDVVVPTNFFSTLQEYLDRLPPGWGCFQAHYVCPSMLEYLHVHAHPRTILEGYLMSCACYVYSRAGMNAFLDIMGKEDLSVPLLPCARAEELVYRYVRTFSAMHPLINTDESFGSSIPKDPDMGHNVQNAELLACLKSPQAFSTDIFKLPFHTHWMSSTSQVASMLLFGRKKTLTVIIPAFGAPHVEHKAALLRSNLAAIRTGPWSRVDVRILAYTPLLMLELEDGEEVVHCGPGILGDFLRVHAKPASVQTDYVLLLLDDVELPAAPAWDMMLHADMDVVSPCFEANVQYASMLRSTNAPPTVRSTPTCEFFCYLMPLKAYAVWHGFLRSENPWTWGMDLILWKHMGLRAGICDATMAKHHYTGEAYAAHPHANAALQCSNYLACFGETLESCGRIRL